MDTCNWILGHLGVGLLLVGVQVSTEEKDSLPEENFCYLPQDGMSWPLAVPVFFCARNLPSMGGPV